MYERSETTKAAIAEGFNSLQAVIDLTGVSRSTLKDWYNKDPQRWRMAMNAARYQLILQAGADGVYDALPGKAKQRTSFDNVADVLKAIKNL